MKTKMYFLGIFLLALTLGATAKIKDGRALTGNSFTDLGKYTIVKAQNSMVVEKQALPTYELYYENASNPILIGILKEKNNTNFLVRSNEFEVQYACSKNVFGVKKMDKKFRELPEVSNDSKIDKRNYYAQRVITQNQKSEEELLGLIACYLPSLILEHYHAQL
jgi:hypothetical protein